VTIPLCTLVDRTGTEKLARTDEMVRWAAHPRHRAFLDLPTGKEHMCTDNIGEPLGVEPIAPSQRLRRICDKCLWDVERKGKHSSYYPEHPMVKYLEGCCEHL
jgi:hypothetical protein